MSLFTGFSNRSWKHGKKMPVVKSNNKKYYKMYTYYIY